MFEPQTTVFNNRKKEFKHGKKKSAKEIPLV